MYRYKVDRNEIEYILKKQVESLWGGVKFRLIKETIPSALERMYMTLSDLALARCNNGREVIFSPYDTVSWSVFLYYLANSLYKKKYIREAEVVYYLNKVMHSVDWYYGIELPPHFWAEHPQGSVLGKACYGDYFFCFHGTTVGANYKKDGTPVYPVLGKNVFMCANTMVLGKSTIGDNVIISANTYIKDRDIPNNSIVYGNKDGEITIKPVSEREIKNRTSGFWHWDL